MRVLPLVAICACVWGRAVAAQAPPADVGEAVYSRLVRSTVWIQSNRGTSLATGSGALIDRRRRLVLTNYHVVGDGDRVTVVFPIFRDGKLVAERDVYQRRLRDEGIRGRVVARDRSRDLALIELDRVPAGAFALALAEKSATPGQDVHSIGNPGGSGALWVYTPGKVRQVYKKRWRADLDGRIAEFAAEVVETNSATNPGDSGGPLVNDRGELVGVTQGAAIKANSLSTFIDVSEVRRFLNSPEVKREIGGDGVSTRTAALTSHDGAKFVAEETLRKFNETAKAVYLRTGKDLVLETFAAVPSDKAAAVKAMSAEQKEKFYHDWAADRVKAEDIHGILLLVSREPSRFYVWVPRDPTIGLREEDARRLQQIVRDSFRDKKFDEGVVEFAKVAAQLLTR